MIDKGRLRNLNQKEREAMKLIFEITVERRRLMERIEVEMRKEFDSVFEQITYKCVYCKKQYKGAAIGQHYRVSQECKYMKDRPFLTQLPKNWKEDLKTFLDEENKNGVQ